MKECDVLSIPAEAIRGTAARGAAMTRRRKPPPSETLLERVLSSLGDDKAENVVSIDLRGKTEIADYMVVCSGRSSRQVSSISEKLADRLKREFGLISKIEGKEAADWALIDAGDVIVHVFRPEVREFYQLEKLWADPDPKAAARP